MQKPKSNLFGWDDKWPGAQVLMAQLTQDGGYTRDVTNYFNHINNQHRFGELSLKSQVH